MTPFLKNIHEGKKFLIMNLVINISRRELVRTKVNCMKKLSFPSCDNMMFNVKSKAFIFKTKGFAGST